MADGLYPAIQASVSGTLANAATQCILKTTASVDVETVDIPTMFELRRLLVSNTLLGESPHLLSRHGYSGLNRHLSILYKALILALRRPSCLPTRILLAPSN